MKLNIFIPGIQAIVSIVCVSLFLIQSFMLIGDYFKEETFVTPSKKRLEDMPSPRISFCDKYYADRLYITEDVATLAGNYSSDYQHNESNILNSFPKERTYLYYFWLGFLCISELIMLIIRRFRQFGENLLVGLDNIEYTSILIGKLYFL